VSQGRIRPVLLIKSRNFFSTTKLREAPDSEGVLGSNRGPKAVPNTYIREPQAKSQELELWKREVIITKSGRVESSSKTTTMPKTWDVHKDEIMVLYIAKGQTLNEVRKSMANRHGFKAS